VVATNLWTPAGGVAGEFKYVAVTPVVLGANREYYLVSREVAGQDQWHDASTVRTTGAAGVLSLAWSPDGTKWNVGVHPGQSFVPVDLKYERCEQCPLLIAVAPPKLNSDSVPAGTWPNEASTTLTGSAAVPALGIAMSTNGMFELTISGGTGRSFRIEASTNLTDWVEVTNFVSIGTTTRIWVSPVVDSGLGYFRAVELP